MVFSIWLTREGLAIGDCGLWRGGRDGEMVCRRWSRLSHGGGSILVGQHHNSLCRGTVRIKWELLNRGGRAGTRQEVVSNEEGRNGRVDRERE